MVTIPESTEDLIYFTRRAVDNGKIMAWVYKKQCPQCNKAVMGKPVEKGKVKIRAKEYVCPSCGFTEEKIAHEEQLTMEIQYTCPYCKKSNETTTLYKRKNFDGIPSYVFVCVDCGKKIAITKKMKQKKGSAEVDDDDDVE